LIGARFGLTLETQVHGLIADSELIRQTAARWFSQPVSDILTSAKEIASTFYADRENVVAGQASRLAAGLSTQALVAGDMDALKASLTAPVMDGRVGMVEVYRVRASDAGAADVTPVLALQSPSPP